MKTCTGCETSKDTTEFAKDKRSPDGYQTKCKACNKAYYEANKARKAEYGVGYRVENKELIAAKKAADHKANPDVAIKRMRQWRQDDPERAKLLNANSYQENKELKDTQNRQWAKENSEKMDTYKRKWDKDNAKQKTASRKAWKAANPGKVNAATAKRRCAKLQRTPPWLTKDDFLKIEEFYIEARRLTEATGISYEVDHIIPLQGKNVSGLHVPSNLQIITATNNQIKSNKAS